MVNSVSEFRKRIGVHITTRHNGKMEGMHSLSTSCLKNNLCKERSKNKASICSHCYASRLLKMYKNTEYCLSKNTDILTKKVLIEEELPILNVLYFRLEAFGDLINTMQVLNYFNLCNKNPQTRFAIWTKNPQLIEQTIHQGHRKPQNLNVVLSSPFLNKEIKNKYDFVDVIFTVYDKETIDKEKILINCGDKKCLECLKCYKKHEDLIYINEKIK